ncbi:hypothetical protein VNO80_25195 [Phaseolus coccineus]|uniref:Uncharacterized protein n=1 Tax=Phaseolus coccineus TaxID=3886 RepID=A0AAN9LTU2_PHACN
MLLIMALVTCIVPFSDEGECSEQVRNAFLSGKDAVDGNGHSSKLEGERAEKTVGATTNSNANPLPVIEGFQTNLTNHPQFYVGEDDGECSKQVRNAFLSGKDAVDGDGHSSELEGERVEKTIGATTNDDANPSLVIKCFQTNLINHPRFCDGTL